MADPDSVWSFTSLPTKWRRSHRGRRHVVEYGPHAMSDLLDFEERARAVLPPHIGAFCAAAAGSGIVVAEGTPDWAAVRFSGLTDELAHVMVQLGTASIDELTPDLLA
jgi:hypothetical protein